jgi:hypothetical protein
MASVCVCLSVCVLMSMFVCVFTLGAWGGVAQKFTVVRRRPLFNAKQERTFAIDGDTIRTMPSDAAAADASSKVVSVRLTRPAPTAAHPMHAHTERERDREAKTTTDARM